MVRCASQRVAKVPRMLRRARIDMCSAPLSRHSKIGPPFGNVRPMPATAIWFAGLRFLPLRGCPKQSKPSPDGYEIGLHFSDTRNGDAIQPHKWGDFKNVEVKYEGNTWFEETTLPGER